MSVDHPCEITRQLKLDMLLVLHLLVFENQESAPVAGAVEIPFEINLGEIFNSDRAEEKNSYSKSIFAGERCCMRFRLTIWSTEDAIGQQQELPQLILVLQNTQSSTVRP